MVSRFAVLFFGRFGSRLKRRGKNVKNNSEMLQKGDQKFSISEHFVFFSFFIDLKTITGFKYFPILNKTFYCRGETCGFFEKILYILDT